MTLTIEPQRSPETYASLADERAARELERARAGEVDDVSARAAARFLRIHVETLGQWRRRNPPLGPPWRKGADGLGTRNEHVSYSYAELVAWKQGQQGKTHKQRWLTDELERQRQRIVELELELAVEEAKKKAAQLAKKLGRVARFATVADLTTSTPWVSNGAAILGHVLTVGEGELIEALDRDWVVEASLLEALELPWAHSSMREPFSNAALSCLADSQSHLESLGRAQVERDMEASFAAGSTRTSGGGGRMRF